MANAGADEAGRWYVTPQIGALVTDDDRNIRGDGDRLFGLGVGKHVSERWSLELNANGAKMEGFAPYAASLDALRVFRRNQNVSPYLTIGAGAIRNDIDAGTTCDCHSNAQTRCVRTCWTKACDRRKS